HRPAARPERSPVIDVLPTHPPCRTATASGAVRCVLVKTSTPKGIDRQGRIDGMRLRGAVSLCGKVSISVENRGAPTRPHRRLRDGIRAMKTLIMHLCRTRPEARL